MVDSDILSYYMKKQENVVKNLDDYINDKEYVYISRISVVEILVGLKFRNAVRQIRDFNALIRKYRTFGYKLIINRDFC